MFRRLATVNTLVFAALALVLTAAPARAQGLKHLAADTEVVVSVNLKQIWNSKLVKDYSDLIKQLQSIFNVKLESNELVADIKKSLGIDLFKDVDVITAGMSNMGKSANWVMVVEGRFKPDKFEETGKKSIKDSPEVVKSSTIGATTVYEISPPGGQSFFMALLDKSTLLMAKTKEGMSTAIQPPAQNLKMEVVDLLKETSLKKSFVMIATANAMIEGIKDSGNPEAIFAAPLIKGLEGAVVSADVISDIVLNVGFVAKDAATAELLQGMISKGLDSGKEKLGQGKKDKTKPALETIKTMKVSTQGKTVTIQGMIPREVVDGILEKIEDSLP
jgi:hypothetical protein